MKFTAQQLKAINHTRGNLQLVACAGSGKTEVVARRVVNLLRSGIKPGGIVAFTYTNKAAGELKERIAARCREAGIIYGLAEMFVGTVHAFCLELLQREVPRFLKFDLLNEVQQLLFINRCSTKSGLTGSTDLNGVPLRRFIDTGHYLASANILRESVTVPRALANCSVADHLSDYRDLLEGKSYFDYSSIMEEAFRALSKDLGLRRRLKETLRHVIVDEYQDVNPIQEKIVSLLHDLGAQICVVGDDDQTIYQWRGSNVQNILTFQNRYPGVTQIRLEDNFRSSEGIIATARSFIEQNQERLPKSMQPANAQDYRPGDIAALSFDDPQAEALHIAQTIKALHGVAIKDEEDPGKMRGIAYSDMAILLRSVSGNAKPITDTLRQAGIPCIVMGMNNLFATPEAEAARQLFYFMAGPTVTREEVTPASLKIAWLRAGMGLKAANVLRAISEAELIRNEFNAGDQRNLRFSLQRVYLEFLKACGLREEQVPGNRGEIIFYNLGKVTQVISDFEAINYHSQPIELYRTFAGFLQYSAENSYPEGWQDNQHANPDAVRLMTVHQAKGLQWPVVFVPALLRNRFPSMRHGGRTVWHLIPKVAVKEQARYEGTTEDERRLFYVAVTRSQKFLHLTWAPVPGSKLYQRNSEFWDDVRTSKFVVHNAPNYAARKHLAPTPRQSVTNVVFSFSELKYFFECAYQFKLRILCGFNSPIHEELGFGRSVHNALAEVHARAIRGDYVTQAEVPALVATHLYAPFANSALKVRLGAAAQRIVGNYIEDNRGQFDNIEYSEKQIEISLSEGVSVVGRIDLVRRKDTDETTIVDLKSNKRTQAEEVTEEQLHIYALGYEELTGRQADFVEVYELDDRKSSAQPVNDRFMNDIRKKVGKAAQALRENRMLTAPSKKKCAACDYHGLCTAGSKIYQP